MKPTTVPVAMLWPGAKLVPVGVTREHEAQDIGRLEVVVDIARGGARDGMRQTHVRIELEDGDLEALQENPHFWISHLGVAGNIYPFSVQVEASVHAETATDRLERAVRRLLTHREDLAWALQAAEIANVLTSSVAEIFDALEGARVAIAEVDGSPDDEENREDAAPAH